MEIVAQNLFQTKDLPVMIVVTTNSFIKHNGALVMGRGAAKEARDMVKGIDLECGRAITKRKEHDTFAMYQDMYGFVEIRPWTRPGKGGFGIFQVKHNFKDKAQIDLINYSCQTLAQWIRANEFKCPVRMNFPGIGNGQLSRDKVEPILQAHFKDLPVTVCVR
jgi:hypothetical protein